MPFARQARLGVGPFAGASAQHLWRPGSGAPVRIRRRPAQYTTRRGGIIRRPARDRSTFSLGATSANIGEMFEWWRRRKRERILEQPFPEGWRDLIARNLGYWRWLTAEERSTLEQLVQVFLAEKTLLGCGGLELDDEIRLTIAANACMLLIGLDHDLYAEVQTVLVYPSTVRAPQLERSLFDTSVEVVEPEPAIHGEAHLRGPVILVWDAVKHDSRHPTLGHNVVFHEFAHKLDMLDNSVDGTPPLSTRAAYERWSRVCGEVYFDLRRRSDAGEHTFLDPYAATSEAEFFAVATETFFETPHAMCATHPELYELLRDYYRQDPATRMPAPAGSKPPEEAE